VVLNSWSGHTLLEKLTAGKSNQHKEKDSGSVTTRKRQAMPGLARTSRLNRNEKSADTPNNPRGEETGAIGPVSQTEGPKNRRRRKNWDKEMTCVAGCKKVSQQAIGRKKCEFPQNGGRKKKPKQDKTIK